MAVAGEPDIRGIVLALARDRVEWVLAGSIAALAWYPGRWPFEPGDLDVVPECSAANLERLARLLARLRARAVHHPGWSGSLSPEECASWVPAPASEERLDHLFDTTLGRLDVVPSRAGRFEALRARGQTLLAWDVPVRVADPADLATTMRPGKAKHAARRALMVEILARGARGESPCRLTPD